MKNLKNQDLDPISSLKSCNFPAAPRHGGPLARPSAGLFALQEMRPQSGSPMAAPSLKYRAGEGYKAQAGRSDAACCQQPIKLSGKKAPAHNFMSL